MSRTRAPFENTYALRALQAINRLIDQGRFVVSRFSPEQGGVPVVPHNEQVGIRSAREYHRGEMVDGATSWGKFRFDAEANVYVLVDGSPPEKWLPQERLEAGVVTLYPRSAVACAGERAIELDLTSEQHEGPYELLYRINQALFDSRIPVMIWRLEWEQEQDEKGVEVITLLTEHVRLAASSAVWDDQDSQLVAAQVMFTDPQEIKALRATLANNSSKEWLRVVTEEDNAFLRGARRGFIGVSAGMSKQHAQGNVAALLNPLTGDPQMFSEDHFYVVATPGEDITEKFVQRLDLATPWPADPQWGEYLIESGVERGLVTMLKTAAGDFETALRVEKDAEGWREVIQRGLSEGQIALHPG
jgi:hypothetical protein